MSKMKFTRRLDTGRLSEQDAKRYFSTVGLATCALMGIYYVGTQILSLACLKYAPRLLDNPWVSNLLSIIPLYVMAFPIFWLILRQLPRDTVGSGPMGAKGWVGGLCVAFALMMAGSYLSNILTTFFGIMLGYMPVNPVAEATSGQAWWINLIFVAILAPILEELVFRKVLCDRLLPLGEGYTVVLSAAIFGLAHGNFFQFFYAFFLGAIFALVYVKTGRIRYSMLYHAVINLLGGVLAPWVLEKLDPLLEGDNYNALMDAFAAGNTELVAAVMAAYRIPLLLLFLYEALMIGFSIAGVVLLVKGWRKIRLQPGLLPPPEEGRVSNVLLNVGAASALTVFAVIFILSLL